MEQEPGGGPFRVCKCLPVWLCCRPNISSMPVFALRTDGRVGVQLHVGALKPASSGLVDDFHLHVTVLQALKVWRQVFQASRAGRPRALRCGARERLLKIRLKIYCRYRKDGRRRVNYSNISRNPFRIRQ